MKKVPMRQCLGCREMKPKRELIRVVRSPEGEVSLDFTGKKHGRGAYMCHSEECLGRAVKSKALSRAFGVPIPQSIIDELRDGGDSEFGIRNSELSVVDSESGE